jgi:aconitate hydratase
MAPGTEGGWTIYQPDGGVMTIYDAAMKYKSAGVPLVIVAGKEYGSGSSRDWAAKGTLLLGVKAVIAESFERIHRSNLVNMGVLPLQFQAGATAAGLGLTGKERLELTGIADGLRPGSLVTVRALVDDQKPIEFQAVARIDTPEELVAFRHGGILPYVVRQLVRKPS